MGILDRFRVKQSGAIPTEPQLYVVFPTTAEAMATERVCKTVGLSGKLVPMPRQLSAGCGIAWRTSVQVELQLRELLEQEGITYDAIATL